MSTDYHEGFYKGMEAARLDYGRGLKIGKCEGFINGIVVGLIIFAILACFTGC